MAKVNPQTIYHQSLTGTQENPSNTFKSPNVKFTIGFYDPTSSLGVSIVEAILQ
jgi:hypothetical protein